MPERPCLQIIRIDPPTLKCSACGKTFTPKDDSLRQVLRDFRTHIIEEHPNEASH